MSAVQIYKLENNKYRLDLPAINEILNKAENHHVAIYSLSGPLRTGKSFMLGFFLRYLKSEGLEDWVTKDLESTFTFQGGDDGDTTGIWMWSEPFLVKKKNGPEVSVFLLDTQGLFDRNTDTKDNAIVFALSTLLSSVVIFNINRQIDQAMLQFFECFVGFARLADKENENKLFQKLLFLIRDWQFSSYDFGYYNDRTPKDGKNYKKDRLDPNDNQKKEIKSTREMISSTFEDVACYLLPHPGREVARNSKFHVSTIDPEFVDHLRKFVPLVLNNEAIVAKKIGGSFVTGGQLMMFVKEWATLFESNAVPRSETVFQATAKIHNEMEKTKAINNYKREMEAFVKRSEVSDQDFEENLRKLVKECKKHFENSNRLGGKEYEEKCTNEIEEELNKQIKSYLEQREKEVRHQDELRKKEEEQREREKRHQDELWKKEKEQREREREREKRHQGELRKKEEEQREREVRHQDELRKKEEEQREREKRHQDELWKKEKEQRERERERERRHQDELRKKGKSREMEKESVKDNHDMRKDVMSGAAAGATIGALTGGPFGAAIGGGLGAAFGAISNRFKENIK